MSKSLIQEFRNRSDLELAEIILDAGYSLLCEQTIVDEDFWAAALVLSSRIKRNQRNGETKDHGND